MKLSVALGAVVVLIACVMASCHNENPKNVIKPKSESTPSYQQWYEPNKAKDNERQ